MGQVTRIKPWTAIGTVIRVSARRTSHFAFRTAILWLCIVCAHAESIDRVVLPSGLTVILAEQHTTQAVEVRVAVRAGPVHEGEHLGSGLSLLTQRLVGSAGTGALNAGQAREALTRLGDRGGSATQVARSEFTLTTTATNLAAALGLLANRLATPAIAIEDLERERASMSVGDPLPEHAAVMGLLFRQHPARLPLSGLAPLRASVTLEQIQAYHGARYRTATTVVVICGNINAADARRQVEQAFAAYPLGGYAPQPLPVEPPPLAPRFQTLTSPTAKQPRIIITWRTEMLDHAAQPGLAVLAAWLGGEQGVIARLLSAKGVGQDSVVEHVIPNAIPGYLQMSFTTTPERRAEAEQALYRGLDSLGQGALDDLAIAAARAAALRRLAQRQSTVQGLCDELLAWEFAAGDPAYVRRFADQVGEVDAVEVLRVLRRYLLSRDGDRGRCTLVLKPGDPKPVRPAEAGRPPTPVSVVAPEVITLAQGVRLMLRPSLEQPLARVHVVLGGGAAVEDRFQHGATSLLASLMCRATETRTPADIEALLIGRGMQLTTSADLQRLDLGVSCFPRDVPMALDLLVDCVSKAALPLDELELLRQRATTGLANEPWERRFLAEVRAATLVGHYAEADPHSAKRGLIHLDRSVLLSQYRRLAVGANTVLAVYGRFDRAQVLELARRRVTAQTGLAEGAAVRPLGTPWGERAGSSLTVTTHDAPVAALALVWRGPAFADRAKDEAAMQVLGALLEGRLARAAVISSDGVPTRLQTLGEVYDQRGIWMVWGSCDDRRLEAIQQAVRDEVARFIAQLWLPEGDRGALPDGELVAAKVGCAVRWALEQEDLDRVAVRHATHLLWQQDLTLDLTMPDRLGTVGRKDLLRVAQAWLAGEPLTILARPKGALVVPLTGAPGQAAATAPPASSAAAQVPVGAVPGSVGQGGVVPVTPPPTAPAR